MSFTRTSAFVGLTGLGLWLCAAAPVHAETTSAAPSSEPTPAAASMGTDSVSDACTFNGIKLAGKVQVVDRFPDIRVKAVSRFPDLKVKRVDSFADDCGEWQFVDQFADFKIQYVESFPDVEVAWVDSFPGMP